MKHVILLVIFFLSSCTKPTLIGHWKCDASGTVVGKNKNDQMQTETVKEFYKLLGIHPLEIEFLGDEKAKTISRKLSGESYEYIHTLYKNHQGSIYKYLLRQESNHGRDIVMTLKSLSNDTLKASFDMIEDDMILDLKLYRLK